MKPLWLIGGLGLGAGLMYMLDPAKGERRREFVRSRLADYGRQTEDFLGDTTQTMGRQARNLLARTHMPRRHQPGFGERLLAQAEQHGTIWGLVTVGLVSLGASLLYMLDLNQGPKRRVLLRDTARNYWHKADASRRSATNNAEMSVR